MKRSIGMSLKEQIIYYLLTGFIRALGYIPVRARDYLASQIARLWFNLDKRHRVLAMKNLAMVFDKKSRREIRDLARDVFRQWVLVFFEIGWGFRLDKRNFSKYADIVGWNNVLDAYRKKKGILFCTGHLGNWEIMIAGFQKMGLPINVVYRPIDFKPFDRFINTSRTRLGLNLIPVRNAVDKIKKRLSDREMIAMLIDQNASYYNGVFIDFMGHEACSSQGMARLALATGAPVVPGFMVRDRGRYRMEFLPEIQLIRTGDFMEDVRINTARYNKAVADYSLKYANQWLWMHNRWKTKSFSVWPRQQK